MLCPDSKNTSPLTAAHTTPLGTLTISSPHVLLLGCDAGWRNSNSQGKRATRITRALSLTLVTLSCPSALDFASSAMAPGQDRNSASPATLLPARHPPQATSLFLATVAPEVVLAHLKHIARVQPVAFPRRFVFVSDNLPNVLKTSISR